jgi:hypothetical protein
MYVIPAQSRYGVVASHWRGLLLKYMYTLAQSRHGGSSHQRAVTYAYPLQAKQPTQRGCLACCILWPRYRLVQ